jgi:hypothetical protein
VPTKVPGSVYHEEQRFRQRWIWLLVLGTAAIAWWSFIQQVLLDRPFGNKPAPDWGVWLILLPIGVGLPLLFLRMVLVLDVTSEAVVIRYRPLTTRVIDLAETEQVRVREYSAIKEYGGWGLKGWSRNKVAYNVSGNRGVELLLRDGRTVMLGSQHPQELAQAIQGQRRRINPMWEGER